MKKLGSHSKQGNQEKTHGMASAQKPMGSKGVSHTVRQQTRLCLFLHLPLDLSTTWLPHCALATPVSSPLTQYGPKPHT